MKIQKKELENLISKPLPQDFPNELSYMGNIEILKKPKVAIIGSRHPTLYGRKQAHLFSRLLALQEICVISGGAIGIDGIANTSCNDVQRGSVVVLGSGIEKFYPSSNIPMFKKILETGGLILSEFKEDTPAQKWYFPQRNKTIAALADLVVVIEAQRQSGSLITANEAISKNTPVGALPGMIDSDTSMGTNYLIQNGAYCITSIQDIIDILSQHVPMPSPKKNLFEFT